MFHPKFEEIHIKNSLLQDVMRMRVAVQINAPHEPKAVDETYAAINELEHYFMHINPDLVITQTTIRGVHAAIATWLAHPGSYRTIPVQINNQILDHITVPQQMADLHPYRVIDVESLKEWYRLFQEIHPFEDGNGRAGGVIIAGISMAFWGYYLVPKGI